MYYLIRETLAPCGADEIATADVPYVAVLTPEEWRRNRERFAMGIDMDAVLPALSQTRAIVNYDSLTGNIAIPAVGDSEHLSGSFAFALDERGVVFIDGSGLAECIVQAVAESRRWRMPGLERFLYDFLEQIIAPDLARLEQLEQTLESLEAEILTGDGEPVMARLNDIRGDLLDLNLHYGQLLDLGLELEENENGFFEEENLRYFRLFAARADRLRDMVNNMRDYTVQLRDLIQTRIDVKQNRIITLLTVITTIFTPLTLLTGWYGMNFRYMPELESRWGYPAVIAVSLAIAGGCLLYFKRKKWM
ncbi:MAG: magnesium transporter CorA [Lachnospiraceae bacterium]|nr:magnesium transporter CorA [Lachnospiraceae bacterium]